MKNKKTYGDENDLNLKSLVVLTRCFQSVQKREMETIKMGGLTRSQFGVLEILYHKGDLRIQEIIEGTLSTGGNMTVVISNLESNGCVKRYPDVVDKRASLISLTQMGRDLMDSIFLDHVNNVSNIFNVLTTQEKYTLIGLLKKLGSYT